MAASKPYLDFILEQLFDLEDIRFRAIYHLLPRKK